VLAPVGVGDGMALSGPGFLAGFEFGLAPDDCSGVFSFDWRAWMISGADASLLAGTTVDAQFWSRDPPSSFSVNLSNALEFTIGA
jgi:hypothetical protein